MKKLIILAVSLLVSCEIKTIEMVSEIEKPLSSIEVHKDTFEDLVLKQEEYLNMLRDCEYFITNHKKSIEIIETQEVGAEEQDGLVNCVVGVYGKQSRMVYDLSFECDLKKEIPLELMQALGIIKKKDREKVVTQCLEE